MNSKKFSIESLIYLLLFALALAVRLGALGRASLTDNEASLALQSLGIARGTSYQIGASPLYVLLTSLLFSLGIATDFMARFWPALAGSLLVLAPLFYRRFLGKWPALILALFLALDPDLLALSRQADSTILAVALLALAAGAFFSRRPILTGLLSGLALLSGPILWMGVLSLVIAGMIFSYYEPRSEEKSETEVEIVEARSAPSRFDYRSGVVGLLLTFVIVGTLFLRVPTGISGAASSLTSFLRGWLAPSGVGVSLLFAALLFYQPVALLLGIWGIVSGLVRRDPVDKFLSLWFLAALFLILIYPGRQVTDLAWPLLPLWALAARQAARLFALPTGRSIVPTLFQAALAIFLLVFVWMNIAPIFFPVPGDENTNIVLVHVVAIMGALLLLVLTSLLIGLGWSWPPARTGLIWGISIILFLYTLSASWASAGLSSLSAASPAELYQSSAPVSEEDLMVKTIGDLAMWRNGNRNIIDVAVAGVSSPALKWALRDISQVDYMDALPPSAKPSIVITNDQQKSLESASTYRGQSFVWLKSPAWSVYLGEDWARWLLHREATFQKQNIILWARSDLFYTSGAVSNP